MVRSCCMKKRIYFFLCLILVLFVIPVSAQNDTKILTSDNWSYFKNDTGWTLSAYNGSESAVEIPAEINETPVTQLGPELFKNNTKLESVLIPDSIITIGKNAFFGCVSLKEVKISENLKTIPEGCFRYCLSLENIELPYILTTIGKDAFSDCLALREISIPPNVTTVGETAFAYCENLEKVSVPRKLTTVNANAFIGTAWFNQQTDKFVFIGRGILLKYNGDEKDVEVPYGTASISNAFQGNVRIESVVLPRTVLRITQNAFRDAANLKTINIPEFVTTIGGSAFEGCRSLTNVILPSTVTSLGGSAFRYCSSLTKMDIPEKVKNIPGRFLGDCPKLENVRIPESVTGIDVNAFAGSENIRISIVPNSPAEAILIEREISFHYYQASTEDYSYNNNGKEIEIVRYDGINKFVDVPAQINGLPVTSIGNTAFQGNAAVREISIPFTVKTIGDSAFSNMENLEHVYLSFGLEKIGSNVFSGSDALADIYIPKGVRSIGKNIIDASSTANICVVPGSDAESILLGEGYWVYPPDICSAVPAYAEKWTVENLYAGNISGCSEGENIEPVRTINVLTQNTGLVRIPNGTIAVSADMIPASEEVLIIYVPLSVNSIDPQILEGRTVSIAAESGSYAENFSLEYGLNFIPRIISETSWNNF